RAARGLQRRRSGHLSHADRRVSGARREQTLTEPALAEATFPRSISVPAISSRAVEWALAHKAALALLSLMTIAGALRLWGLGGMALHHDESLHAQFSWYLYDGRGYQHDPLMHGPFQFHG